MHLLALYGLLLDVCVSPFVLLMHLLELMKLHAFDTNDWFPHDTTKPAVLLINGTGANELLWLWTRWWYKNEFNTYTMQASCATADQCIEDLAKRAHELIQQMRQEGVEGPITIVGHSMGGLIASYAVESLLSDAERAGIAGVVSIATPFEGVPRLWCMPDTKRHRQMAPNSDFLNTLHTLLSTTDLPYICIGSKGDWQVPWESSRPILASRPFAFIPLQTYTGHTSMIFSPAVFQGVRFLSQRAMMLQ